jgi:NAD(P)-dependent dehydrogenase (short-subunit alcohol dehydrogenase family)
MRRKRPGHRTKGLLVAAGIAATFAGREALARRREADLRGEVALVTGGSRGLGFLLAEELGRVGCRLAICARDARELDRARGDLALHGYEVLAVPCDVADRAQVEHLVAETTRHFGRVDMLVNNAGIIQAGPVEAMGIDDFQTALDVMYWGTVYPTLAVLPQMRERRRGRIVNVTSIGGKVAVPHLLPYDCAKFAAVGFSEGLRAELAREGIVVTTVAPGLMRTGSHLNALFKGPQDQEYALFAPMASLPFISMDAERAARQIVQAARRGEAERILTLPANLLARFHGLFPGLTADLLGQVNRVLPAAADGAGGEAIPGRAVQERLHSPVLTALTGWGQSAARRFHQYPGPSAEATDRPAAARSA